MADWLRGIRILHEDPIGKTSSAFYSRTQNTLSSVTPWDYWRTRQKLFVSTSTPSAN